jgi:hypothetical protein
MRIGFDCDGVLCLTPFGRLAVHAPGGVPELPADYEALYAERAPGGALRAVIEQARFAWRSAAPDARDALQALRAAGHEAHIVTGRSAAGAGVLRRWLRRHGLDGLVADVHMAPPGLRPAQHKLASARMHGLEAHIDDDPRTAYYLAEHGVATVYLYDHSGAHGDESPPANVVLVRSLRGFVEAVTARASVKPPEREDESRAGRGA